MDNNNISMKDKLINAGRYNSIIKILSDIKNITDPEPPVNAYCNYDGITSWRVDGHKLRIEAADLYKRIQNNESAADLNPANYYNLLQVVKSDADNMLHNYANAIMHRKKPDGKPGLIRSYLVLEHMIICIGKSWIIPEGWKKKKNNNPSK